MPKERIIWLDNLKAVLIIIVVFGHCIQHTFTDFSNMTMFRYIYSFHMALFMFVSGYASFRKKIEWSLIVRRTKQLLLPFFIWSLFLSVIKCESIGTMVLHPDQSFWFLWVLYFITIIHIVACKIAERYNISSEYITLLCAFLMLGMKTITKTSMFDFNLITYHFIFYIAGFYSHKYLLLERFSIKAGVLLLICWLISGWFWDMGKPVHQSSFYNAPMTMGAHYIIAGIAIAAFCIVSSHCFNTKCKYLTQMGGVL